MKKQLYRTLKIKTMEISVCIYSRLLANYSSVNRIAEHCTKSPIIHEILSVISLCQSALSRFFSKDFELQSHL